MKKEPLKSPEVTTSETEQVEYELGVPIPGKILPRENWAQTAIKQLPFIGPMDWSAIFERSVPIVLDIGCGNGRFAISSAVRRPSVDHIGVDLLPVVIRYATRRGNQRGLTNVRFCVCDGFQFLEKYVARQSISEIHVYHPQPFHADEDRHRRMMTPEFLKLIHQSLTSRGQLFLQTDSRAYWDYFKIIVEPMFHWQEHTGMWPEDPYGRSRRELIANGLKLPILRAVGTRHDELDDAQLNAIVEQLPLPHFRSTAPSKRRKRRR